MQAKLPAQFVLPQSYYNKFSKITEELKVWVSKCLLQNQYNAFLIELSAALLKYYSARFWWNNTSNQSLRFRTRTIATLDYWVMRYNCKRSNSNQIKACLSVCVKFLECSSFKPNENLGPIFYIFIRFVACSRTLTGQKVPCGEEARMGRRRMRGGSIWGKSLHKPYLNKEH